MPAVDVQRVYLAAAQEKLAGRGADTDWTLREWERTLDGLEQDPLALSDRLDWVAKRSLLADYVESEGVGWDDEALPSYDLAYSNVDPDEGLYYALEQSGEMQRLTTTRRSTRRRPRPRSPPAPPSGAAWWRASPRTSAPSTGTASSCATATSPGPPTLTTT